ncbi:MAG: UDP-N-acetylmuramoyl-tripeptide--D-alanyl-D-alanine ligase [Pseudomonadota bacterium]
MSMGTLSDLAKKVKGQLVGLDESFSAVSTDTRNIQKGQLFIALKGPNFDGCEFVQDAADLGAAGALVDRVVNVNITQVQVSDTRQALAEFASTWRAQFKIPVVAVTGSNGKTTIKQLLAQILAKRGPILSTRGNLNNDIGLPLTLLDINKKHWAAVVEMGANHHGEIGYLTDLALPTVGIISNARAAHLEGFGSIEGVARAKGELFARMPNSSVAIVNADDKYCDYWHEVSKGKRVVTFGNSEQADVRVHDISQEIVGNQPRLTFDITHAGKTCSARIHFAGAHNAYNAAAAVAASLQLGLTLEQACDGLSGTKPVASRMNIRESVSGATIVDDSYNANPASLKAGVEFLTSLGG